MEKAIWRKVTSYVVTAIMVFSLVFGIPERVKAKTQNDGTYKYVVNEAQEAVITGLVDKTIENIEIPRTIGAEKYPVVGIGDYAFRMSPVIKSVTIPGCVSAIGNGSFMKCFALQSVKIEDGVDIIGDGTFADCKALCNLQLPENMESIGDYSFYNCRELKKVRIPNGLERINILTFSNCIGLTSVNIPESVKIIDEQAFIYCMNLEDISIPAEIEEIGEEAFLNVSAQGTMSITGDKGIAKKDLDRLKNDIVSNSKQIQFAEGKWTITANYRMDGTVSIDGTMEEGNKITAHYIPDETGYNIPSEGVRYRWYRVSENNSEEEVTGIGNTYTLGLEDKNKVIQVKVSAVGYVGMMDATIGTFPSPEVTESPVITQSPEETENPVITQSPKETESPVITQSPEDVENPVITQSPKVTGSSAITQSPKVIESPVKIDSPVATVYPKMMPDSEPAVSPCFGKLKLGESRNTQTTISIKWAKVKDADGYRVYSAKWNEDKKECDMKQIADILDGGITTWISTNLTKGTKYIFQAEAYKIANGKKEVVSKSVEIQEATKGGMHGTIESVEITKIGKRKIKSQRNISCTLRKGEKCKIAVKVAGGNLKKQDKVVSLETSNNKVALTDKNGRIKAVGKGSCMVWVYAANGKYKAIKVTVK